MGVTNGIKLKEVASEHLTSCIRRKAVRAALSSAGGTSSRKMLSVVAMSLKGIPTAVLKPSFTANATHIPKSWTISAHEIGRADVNVLH